MNTITSNTKEQAGDELMQIAVKGVVHGSVGLFTCLLEGMTQMHEEKRAAEKEARRITLREHLAQGNTMRVSKMAESLKMYDASIEDIAAELQMPVKELKKSVRAWYSFF